MRRKLVCVIESMGSARFGDLSLRWRVGALRLVYAPGFDDGSASQLLPRKRNRHKFPFRPAVKALPLFFFLCAVTTSMCTSMNTLRPPARFKNRAKCVKGRQTNVSIPLVERCTSSSGFYFRDSRGEGQTAETESPDPTPRSTRCCFRRNKGVCELQPLKRTFQRLISASIDF